MKICFITKYPPIQGGVSTTSYWLAHGLAESGHEVHVVTNSEEVESTYRTLPKKKSDDYDIRCGGRLTVHFTTTETPKHIPFSKIYFTKLFSLGLDVCNNFGCDIVFSFYLEPYGLVGAILPDYLDIPLITRHAGSDISRLLGNDKLRSAYAYALKKSTRIITSPATAKKLIDIGIDKNKFSFNVRDLFPPEVYYKKNIMEENNNQPISIGVYNKFGKSKGIEEIIEALDIIAKEGFLFSLKIVSGGEFFSFVKNKIEASSKYLQQMTSVESFIHPFDIPNFIRGCDIVCDLEHKFPVISHYPRIPKEILMCGSCLVLSEELYQKMHFRYMLKNMDNFVLVKDPSNIFELSRTFRTLLMDRSRIVEIGRRGAGLFADMDIYYSESISEINRIMEAARYDYHISRI